ncbi:pin domain-like partial [Lichtheimia corymbifera JMRC:FSU:9682]|uniref:Pin domain-like partial n=1 Tax=Lichtheimia corymbifera JMRC:FSU:9682 TaxID=1263082 RepID=A0A068S4R0_9FUNG|nr:pin domain-like partial [Lichtheimia corymbifera JMRC:FSU:9682]
MGVTKLWEVIDPAKRSYTLEEISADRANRDNRHQLFIAIDIALWTYQANSSKGGRRPQLRLIFYRFCRLFELGIRAVFVFDGPNRPTFKRDREINTIPVNSEFRRTVIALAKLFNFFVWHANGEAEAECAALERLGFVDMVMTGDVDAFLFGAKRLIRQWPTKRHSPVPCYDMAWITDTTGLDRSDMILIALLRGSDYHHGGERVGIRVAEGLARCKKHLPLMEAVQRAKQDQSNEDDAIESLSQQLIEDLQYELAHGSQGYLSMQYSQIDLDDGQFPDRRILDDFVHPETRIANTTTRDLDQWIHSENSVDLAEIAHFCKVVFEWPPKYLVRRFQNLLFHAFLNQHLRNLALTPSDAVAEPMSSQQKRRKKSESSSSSSSQQTYIQSQIGSFFGVSKGFNDRNNTSTQPKPAILHIRNQKMMGNVLLYHVDFDLHLMDDFTATITSKLEHADEKYAQLLDPECASQGVDDTNGDNNDVEEEDDQGDTIEPEKLCRKWMLADLVAMAFPTMVSKFKQTVSAKSKSTPKKPTRKRSPKDKGKGAQTKLTDYIIPKTTASDTVVVLDDD